MEMTKRERRGILKKNPVFKLSIKRIRTGISRSIRRIGNRR